MFRRNSMMFTLAILTVTACAPELAEPHETDGPGVSTGDDADGGDEAEPTTGAPDDDDAGTTTGSDASTTGSDASVGENAGTTGDASSTGEGDDGDTSGEAPLHDSDGGEPPTEPPGGGAACEAQPCATHEDCNSLDALMCLPLGDAPICVATCDFADPEACDGQPERCTQLDVAAVCLPPIPKVHDDSGACIQSGPNGGQEPSPPPPDVPCEGQPCQSNEDCENGLDDLVCLPDSTVPSRYCVETCDPADAQACDGVPERCTFVGGGMVCLPPIAKTPNDAGVCEPA